MSLRLERFDLRAFGPFTGTVLELGGEGMHIICGPNEVGKSTAQRGIGDFLFGIPPRSSDNHIHAFVNMRLAALLTDGEGAKHELIRRKGKQQTLLGPDNEPVDEALLEGMLGGMTRGAFESMFSITHESLVIGGEALLRADGDVGESLFSASLGATSLHELRAELEREAGNLFRQRGTMSEIAQARATLEAMRAELREATLRATTFAELERELRVAEREREALDAELQEARTEQNARERLRAVIPQLAQRAQVQEELEQLGEAPALPEDVLERRVRAMQRVALDRRAAEDAKARAEDLRSRVAEQKPDESLLEHELAIKDLHGRLASVREGSQDLERQKVMLGEVQAQARRTLEKVRPDLGLEGAAELRLTDAQIAKVDAALERHTRLSALLKQAEQGVEDAEERSRELTAELDGLDDPPDVSLLEAAVANAQAEGQVEKRIREAEQELTDAQGALESAGRRLRPHAGGRALREMSPPSAVAVEQFARQHEELDARARELAERRERIDEARRKFDEEVARLQLSTDVPTVEDLAELRAGRDGEWRQLRRGLEGGEAPDADPDEYERRVDRADEVADRLRVEADSVARKAQLTASERRLEADERELARSHEALEAELAEHGEGWREAWSATGVEPGSPREMIEWLRVREDVLGRADAVARQARKLQSEEALRDEHIEALQAPLAALEVEASGAPTLSGLLEVARARLADTQAARERYGQLARELRTAKATAEGQHHKAGEQRAALEQWKESWAEIAEANGWPPEVGPDSARKTLADVSELAKQLQEVTQLEARAQSIGERLEEFERDARELIAELAPQLSGRPVNDAVAELARKLEEAVKARSSRQALLEGAEKAREELEAVEQSVAKAESELEALVELAGVKTVEELPEAERRAARVEELRRRLPELEAQITESGQASLRELIERTEGMNVDALEAQREEAEGQVAALEERLHALDVRIGELGAEKRKMESLDGAARAAEELQQRVSELRAMTERYLRIYIAGWALAGAIDSYRREHKGPLLKRADELFPELTCGSFGGLEVGFDESDEPILVGVRANGKKAPVGVMSTGTREQLYLALRLASLERYIDAHGPMPVILDDVVLHSDPERKTAILKALAELGRRTQVIAFTHDPQVIALAQSSVDPKLLTIHELGGDRITGALRSQVTITDVHPVPSGSMAQELAPAG